MDDIPQCVAMIRALRQATFWQHLDADSEFLGLYLAHKLLTAAHCCLYVAEQDGQLVGLCGGEISRHFLAPHVPVLSEWAWWVEPNHRTGSAGARLWLTVCAWARERGAVASMRTRVLSAEKSGMVLGEEAYLVKEL